MQDLKEIKELIEWAKTQSIKRLKLKDMEVEFSDDAVVQPMSNKELKAWVNTLEEHSPTDVDEEAILYHSTLK